MNIYEKLQTVRVELQSMELKKSGANSHLKAKYYELGDFLPALNMLLKDHKLCTEISFGDMAILTVTNAEKPDEKVTFTSPMSTASLRNCHDVQNLGAVQTYLRRYLYMNAFDIVEADILDGTLSKDEPKKQLKEENKSSKTFEAVKALSDAQIKRAYGIAKSKGITPEQIKEYIKKQYKKDSFNDVTKAEYDKMIEYIESKPNI